MMSPMRHPKVTVLLFGFSLAACGSEPPPTPPVTTPSLFPLAVGYKWTYRVTESDGTTNTKVQSVTKTATTSFGAGFQLKTARNNDEIYSVQVKAADGKLLRLREESYENGTLKERLVFSPSSLRVDTAVTSVGATYESTHEERTLSLLNDTVLTTFSKTQRFFIEAADEAVTVPAGTYRAVRVRRETVGSVQKTFWYVFGVGKVKETGGQTEELEKVELVETLP
jgi:hypothetical protein